MNDKKNGREGQSIASRALVGDLLRANPPDHTGAGNLHERPIRSTNELQLGTGLAEVAHGTIIRDPKTIVRSHPHLSRPIEAAETDAERLLACRIVGETRD